MATMARGAGDGGEPDDAALVCAAQARPADFAPLYLRYRDLVLAYCFHRLGDPHDAEDAASAVFVKAIHALPAFHDRDDGFRSWLFRIAHNEVADRYKRRARHPHAPFDAFGDAPDPARPPEEQAVLSDARNRLHALLARLPPRERGVLELRAVGLETDEIARALEISAQNVRTAQSRAVAL
jgi:RNA polymerase sigma-70 factor (ECF subfamily)